MVFSMETFLDVMINPIMTHIPRKTPNTNKEYYEKNDLACLIGK